MIREPATQWGGRLTYHMRDEQGKLAYDAKSGVPLTVTVSPRWGAASRIPDGPTVSWEGAVIPPPSPSSVALDRALDHVHDWSGMFNQGRPLPCTRNVLKGVCVAQPHFFREIIRAIRLASTSGVR
jgi:hypothetical protein